MNHVVELPISELKTALTGFSKVINKRATLPELSHIRVSRTPEAVILTATDLDSTVSFELPQPNEARPCNFFVPFEPLNKLVKGSKEPVVLIAEGKAKVRIKSFVGTSPLEQTFDTLPASEFPATPKIEAKGFQLPATFRDSLRHALDCVSDNSTRPVLHHVCLDTRYKDGHYLAATNGSHLFCANSFAFDLKEPVLVPDRGFLRWSKFMEDGPAELAVQPTRKDQAPWLRITSGPWTFITRSGDGQYPNWKQVIPADGTHRTVVQFEPEAMNTLLSAVPKLPGYDTKDKPVRLEVDGGLLVKARSKDAQEWTQLKVEGVKTTGKPTAVTLNREYLLKALRFGLSTLEIEDDLTPVQFIEGGRRMVVMPVRPADAPVPTQPTQPSTPPAEAKQPAQPQPNPMPKTAETTPPADPTPESPIKSVLTKIDSIKEALKNVLRDLTDTNDLLKQVEKDRKASDKEVELVREKLRELQSVRI